MQAWPVQVQTFADRFQLIRLTWMFVKHLVWPSTIRVLCPKPSASVVCENCETEEIWRLRQHIVRGGDLCISGQLAFSNYAV